MKPTPDNAVFIVNRCPLDVGCLPTKFDIEGCVSLAYSHTLNASPVVANSSVEGDF